ncbi:hypothetical protein IB642_04385 [Allofrancisella guangzhouensis]|uniref:Helix-turn-helix type 11 domain-containing protein n=1 Tax=Allofrancisella guangzhouensis TaxID=594679 RepID=A0A0A8EBC1_9GAMM|nr:HTH domain-containing protein [Allofrancisella guangzhouensis]AJC49456.1 hypothetical protein SD28_07415 [Allofrancisella guangzhouensis]MBK2026751.1 hypothetical protein [Allofrancisella guangzhouensis]MBK2044256.1 hypothetical protein [Allofrancisella guangzhouensis]MBK2046169.1 hypothetical protein [Allofrancisella guangzhouensis]
MRIPVEKEFTIKKAVLNAIEKNQSPAKLADSFGVSKSTIYKYRRALRDQGFIKKTENDIYVIVENKFSIKDATPKSGDLFSTTIRSYEAEPEFTKITDIPVRNDMEQRLQSKIEEMRRIKQEHDDEKGVFKKLIGKFKKKY